LRGFKQENNLMRMSQGGRDGKYLAVTSEEGSVRIYNINEEEEILKIMGESKLSVNCVVFGEKNLWFACDQGLLECYVTF
jgi:WD40 repeat protein